MYCKRCATPNEENAWKCATCGEVLQHGYQGQYVQPQQSGKAIASMICSIAGLMMCLFVGQIIGIVLGYSARNEIRASQGMLTGEGFATAGIIIGWIGIGIDILLVLFYAVIFAMFIANFPGPVIP